MTVYNSSSPYDYYVSPTYITPDSYTQHRLSDAYVLSQEIPPPATYLPRPTMMPMGEITCADGHTVLVPQGRGSWLSFTGVMDAVREGPESHAKRRIRVPRVPVGGLLLIVAGLALIGWGLVTW